MDDWQDHALTTRHMHNRNSRRASGKGRANAPFDVRKAFGEYDVKCASWERALPADERVDDAVLELLRLTNDGLGVLGELQLPGVLSASVVLAASRKVLSGVVADLDGRGEEDEEEEEEDEGEDEDDEDDEEEEEEPTRFTRFEKNSFRSPKFWLAWNGTLTLPQSSTDSPPPSPTHARKSHFSDSPPPSPTLSRTGSSFPPAKPAAPTTAQAEGMGYVTFTGNDCRKFKGTLSCSELGWRDVSFTGFKSVSRSESDRMVVWGGRDVETGWREGEDVGERGARLDARRRVIFD